MEYPAAKVLYKLANQTIDLTAESTLIPERIAEYQSEGAGLKLLYGMEKVDQSVLMALELLADEAGLMHQMEAMQRGEVINKMENYDSENRSALHTALRDIFDERQLELSASKAVDLAKQELTKLDAFLHKVKVRSIFKQLLVIGIGGSDLGPRAAYLALKAYSLPKRSVHFISNVDPDDAAQVLKGLDLKETLVAVISKSGKTSETLTNAHVVCEAFKAKGLNSSEYFVSVTAKGSSMDNPEDYLESFYIWDYVGGRYSVTSLVGMLPLSFAIGFQESLKFLRGAHDMDQVALKKDFKENLPLLSAMIGVWNRNFLDCGAVVIIPYSQALSRFPAHVQQCSMESNGKQVDRKGRWLDLMTGPMVLGEPGTNAQHSFFQLIHQGTEVFPVEFLAFAESQLGEDAEYEGTTSQEKLLANVFAQSLALAKGQKNNNPNKAFLGNRQNQILFSKKLDSYTLGSLFAYYEHKTVFQGFLWDINSFDQEGVELGKSLAKGITHLFAKKRAAQDFKDSDCVLSREIMKQLGLS